MRGIGIWALGYDSGSQDLWNEIAAKFWVSHYTPPSQPLSVQAIPEDGAAWVTWLTPASNGGLAIGSYTVTATHGVDTPVTVTTPGTTAVAVAGLKNGTSYSFAVQAVNLVGPSLASAAVSATPIAGAAAGSVTPISPWRILDTRSPTLNQGQTGPLGAGQVATVQVTDGQHVPTTAIAAILNVTATDTTASSFMTVFPADKSFPPTSNVNFGAGQTVPNAVEVGLSSSGQIKIFNWLGSTDVVVDVFGYVTSASTGAVGAGLYAPVSPYRVCDTRSYAASNQCNLNGAGILSSGSLRKIQVLGNGGAGGVPSSGVSAVVLNVTVTDTTAPSFLTVFPDDGTAHPNPPVSSNLNWSPGETFPNRVLVKVPSDGLVDVWNFSGSADVIVDVNGWYTDGTTAASGSALFPLAPARVLDTRIGNGSGVSLQAGGTLTLPMDLRGGIPAGAKAVVLNVTLTDIASGGWMTVYPGDLVSPPTSSDLNFGAGGTVANLTVVRLPANGSLTFLNQSPGSVDVIADVVGYYD